MLLGLVVTYIYAVVGWKLVVQDFKYGFDGSPVWGAHHARRTLRTMHHARFTFNIQPGLILFRTHAHR